jgi:hypothetical protein
VLLWIHLDLDTVVEHRIEKQWSLVFCPCVILVFIGAPNPEIRTICYQCRIRPFSSVRPSTFSSFDPATFSVFNPPTFQFDQASLSVDLSPLLSFPQDIRLNTKTLSTRSLRTPPELFRRRTSRNPHVRGVDQATSSRSHSHSRSPP